MANNAPQPPKKPQSSYFLYYAVAKDEVKKNNPDISMAEL